MKFMRLGSKPDTFQTLGNIRSVASEIISDFIVVVEGVTFQLHKFPLLSKSGKLQRLATETRESANKVELQNLPGGLEVFELCAKFCYGISVTLNAFNAVAVRCAAEYLEMTEAIDKGNLIFKMDVFLKYSIFLGWKDAIIALESTKMFLPLSEQINLVSHCVDALALKTLADPSKVNWSFTYTRGDGKEKKKTEIVREQRPIKNGTQSRRHHTVPNDWWVEDIAELEIDLYSRLILAIESNGRTPYQHIGEALRFYAFKWLPGMSNDQNVTNLTEASPSVPQIDYMEASTKHRVLLEKIVTLLPQERGSIPCSFLLRLLREANNLGASSSSKSQLATRVGLQLEEACLNDLLIPSSLSSANECVYDVDLVLSIVEHFMMHQEQSDTTSPTHRVQNAYEKQQTQSSDRIDFMDSRRSTSASCSSKIPVAKLIDEYLAQISRDNQLSINKFITLAESIPDFARPVHDGLYRAIDVYLKEHPGLTKAERKKVCSLLDCKKLSMEACMHAAQNEHLPLRVVVQVLFFEQVRAAMNGSLSLNDLPSNVRALMSSQEGTSTSTNTNEGNSNALEDGWEAMDQNFGGRKGEARIGDAEKENEDAAVGAEQEEANSKSKGIFNMPLKPKKFLCKLWPIKNFSESGKSCVSSTSFRKTCIKDVI